MPGSAVDKRGSGSYLKEEQINRKSGEERLRRTSPGNTASTGCAATRNGSLACPHWRLDGESRVASCSLLFVSWVAGWGSSHFPRQQRAALLTGSSVGQAHTLLSHVAQGITVRTRGWCWQHGLSLWLLEGNQRRYWFGSSDDLGDKEELRSFWCAVSWCPSPDSQSASSLHSPAHWWCYLQRSKQRRQRDCFQGGTCDSLSGVDRGFISLNAWVPICPALSSILALQGSWLVQ